MTIREEFRKKFDNVFIADLKRIDIEKFIEDKLREVLDRIYLDNNCPKINDAFKMCSGTIDDYIRTLAYRKAELRKELGL